MADKSEPKKRTLRLKVSKKKIVTYTVYAVINRTITPDVWLSIGCGFESRNGKAINLILSEHAPMNARIVLLKSAARASTLKGYLAKEPESERSHLAAIMTTRRLRNPLRA